MDLKEFTSPLPKPWLNIKANSITLSEGSISSSLTVQQQAGVANPSVGLATIWVNNSGGVESTNYLGDTKTYVAAPAAAVPLGNIAAFADTAGDVLEDSGLGTQELIDIVVGVQNLANQITDIAPGGQRDLWQRTVSASSGSTVVYSGGLGMLLNFGNNNSSASYSSDNGVTWSPCVFDVAPGAELLTGGLSDSQGVIIGNDTGTAWSSSDGINFTQTPSPAPAGAACFNAFYFSGPNLWLCGTNTVGHHVMYSADGVTWTLGNSAIQALSFAQSTQSPSICVAVGQVAPFFQYSVDGINWTNTPSTVLASRSITWSSEKAEFVSCGFGNTHTFRSMDGINWEDLGAGLQPGFNNGMMWVDFPYFRYYGCAPDSSNNYSLWSTPDPHLPFVGTHLDGATNNPLNYSLIFIPSAQSFGIGVNNAPFFAYSTPRTQIKALDDNIRVRGMPVSCGRYSTASSTAVNSTAAETIVSSPATSIGSLSYQASQPVGMAIEIELRGILSSAAGDTLTLRYKVNGATMFTNVITVPAASSNLPLIMSSSVNVLATTLSCYSEQFLANVAASIVAATPAYNPAIFNTWSITAQWGTALSSLSVDQVRFVTHFPNGA